LGDKVVAPPSGRSSRVQRIVTFKGDLEEAAAPLSVTITLEDEIDISRGDLLVTPEHAAVVASSFSASLVWMDTTPLDLAKRYLLKHMSRIVQATVRSVMHAVELSNLSSLLEGVVTESRANWSNCLLLVTSHSFL
jgi:sulfate adenylyltransferase subunit 1